MTKINELRFIRVFSSVHIPRYLVEQIKNKNFDIDEFLAYQEENCKDPKSDRLQLNDSNHLYVMANDKNSVKGFIWMVIDELTHDLVVKELSVDKSYWEGSETLSVISEFVKELFKKLQLKRILWKTRYPKNSEKLGFKRSREVLMEYCA